MDISSLLFKHHFTETLKGIRPLEKKICFEKGEQKRTDYKISRSMV